MQTKKQKSQKQFIKQKTPKNTKHTTQQNQIQTNKNTQPKKQHKKI